MNHRFSAGDQVFWWKRTPDGGEHPYRAEVMAVGLRRITIGVENLDECDGRVIRQVDARRLQPVAMYYMKAGNQGPASLKPAALWGQITRYLEVGEDLWAVRHVDMFENGNTLSYDRSHWVDDFGMLADARINRTCNQGTWGLAEEIDGVEFDRIWEATRRSPVWEQQRRTAQMSRRGAVPVWITTAGR